MSTRAPVDPPEPPDAVPGRGRRLDPQFVLIAVLVVYTGAVSLLSPDLPVAVGRFLGIKPTEAFAALIVVPSIAVIIARIVIASRATAK
jgi:hypothetical protein